jgi:Ca2+-binding RTX toxin-like protein
MAVNANFNGRVLTVAGAADGVVNVTNANNVVPVVNDNGNGINIAGPLVNKNGMPVRVKTIDLSGITNTFDAIVSGNNENETIIGHAGRDVVFGNNGQDMISGGAGDDDLSGGGQRDNLMGEAGNDVLRGGTDNDTLDGGADNDMLFGDAGQDQLFGGAGRDTLTGGADKDALTGGAGDDLFVLMRGDANGDRILDLEGAGVAGGDVISLVGYGAGATFAFNANTSKWQVANALGVVQDIVELRDAAGAIVAALAANDFMFS